MLYVKEIICFSKAVLFYSFHYFTVDFSVKLPGLQAGALY